VNYAVRPRAPPDHVAHLHPYLIWCSVCVFGSPAGSCLGLSMIPRWEWPRVLWGV
jgi:hypothetical protein